MIAYEDLKQTLLGVRDSDELACAITIDSMMRLKDAGHSSKLLAKLLKEPGITLNKQLGVLKCLMEYSQTQPVHDDVCHQILRLIEERLPAFRKEEKDFVMIGLDFLGKNYHKRSITDSTRVAQYEVCAEYHQAIVEYIRSIVRIGAASDENFDTLADIQIRELSSPENRSNALVGDVEKVYQLYFPYRYRMYIRLAICAIPILLAYLYYPIVTKNWAIVEPIWAIGGVTLSSVLSLVAFFNRDWIKSRYFKIENAVSKKLFVLFKP
ncbi:MAG: hypothetical protein ABJ308_11425 [Halieaceae bacterium]